MTFAAPSDDYKLKSKRGVDVFAEDETLTFTASSAAQTTTIWDARPYHHKMIYITNTNDQAVTVAVQSLPDSTSAGTEIRTIGSTFSIAAGNVTPQTDEVHLTDYHGFIRISITPGGSATGTTVIKIRAQQAGPR